MRISVNSGAHSARRVGERFPMTESIDVLADAGFDAIDINFFATNKPDRKHEVILDGTNWREAVSAVAARAKERKIPLPTSHLPCFDFTNPDLPDYAEQTALLDRAIEASAMLGAGWAVLHPFGEREAAIAALKPIVARAAEFGLGIVLENKVGYSLDTMLDVVDAFDGRVGVCFDTGHAHIDGLDNIETLVKIGARLKMLHVHDNYGKKDTHDVPFSGNIDWPALMHALRESGYTGDLNFETTVTNRPDSTRRAYLDYLRAVGEALCAMWAE